MRCHDGAGVEWAMEIYAEMQCEEGSEASEDQEWFECEEWPRAEFDFGEEDASVQKWDGRGNEDGETQQDGGIVATARTEKKFSETQTLDSTRGGLVGPEQRTGTSNEVWDTTETSGECFLCGFVGCDCEVSRPWQEVWCGAVEVVRWAAKMRMQQRTVSTVCVGLRGLARSRENFRNNRQKQQTEAKQRKEAQRERDERWRRRWWRFVMVDYEQKRANRALLSLAIKTAVRVQTAVEVEQEARQMREREVAFRRLVIAEQQDKGHRNERKKQGKQGKSEKSEIKKGSYMTEAKHRSVKESNASPVSYEKKSDVIRLREPKIPW